VTDESDNCTAAPVVAWVSDVSDLNTCPEVITRTYSVTDACGNSINVTQTITVDDITAPIITGCLANITVSNDAGDCSADVSWVAPSATDNCGSVTLTSTYDPGDTFPIGTTTVTYTATDNCGNTATCTFTITVTDTEIPAIACPADIIVNNEAGLCGAIVNFIAPIGTDNCPGATTIQTAGKVSGALYPVGTTVNMYQVTDAYGNTNTCSFNVTVVDAENPNIVCPGNLSVTGVCSTIVTYVTPVGTDNCPGATTVQTAGLPSGSTFTVGITTNSFMVTDAAGHTATCSFTVEVIDNTPPVITCPADIVVNNTSGTCSAVVTYTAPVGTDNCPGATTVQIAGLASGSTFPVGTTVNTFRVTDGYGNTAQCSFNVTVNDIDLPVISCPADINVNNDAGICGAVVTYVAPVGTDNCPGAITTLTSGLASGSVFPVGTTTNVFTVVDGSGNSASCSFTVTVVDNTLPVRDLSPLPDVTDECSVTSLIAPTASDNCVAVITGTHNASLPITTQGTTVVTWTYDDGNGNISTQTQNVVIDDVTAPVTAALTDVTGECTATIAVIPTATDNCSGVITGTTSDPLTYNTQGTHTVTWSYDDGNGNISTQTQNVVIDDVTAPVTAALPDVTGECTATIAVTPTAIDNCSGVITGTTADPLTYNTQGTHTVTWSYDDGNGNISTQTQNVVINDITAPTPDSPGLSDVTAECTVTSLTAPTATDNCGGAVTVSNNATLPITTQGTTVVTWTYDDGNGNTATQTQNVVLDDITAPVPDVAVLADVNAACSVAALTAPTATDNCAGTVTGTHTATLPITVTTLVTWTYDDGNGNTVTQTQNVVIADVTAPVPDVATLTELHYLL
ncbi:MAG: HYR domain-containing protein, partial [Bacteroidia bacterium]|nr:HYR domain-containing protein [Bacteroidia bacterium]